MTVQSVWDEYLSEKIAQGKVSVQRMRDAWKALSPHFAAMQPAEITSGKVRDYIRFREPRVGQGTIHTELLYLRAAIRYAVKAGITDKAPHITLPPKARPRGRHLSSAEAKALIDAAQMPHVKLYIQLALFTAGRPSSLLGLTWDRVDFEGRQINLDDPKRDKTSKGRALVPMPEQLVEPLKDAKRAAQTDHVIEWAGQKLGTIKKAIERTAARAGIKEVTAYTLRHSAAVYMAEDGLSMDEIAQFLGHSSPTVTFRTYARYSPGYLQRGTDAISRRLEQGTEVHKTKERERREDEKGTDADGE